MVPIDHFAIVAFLFEALRVQEPGQVQTGHEKTVLHVQFVLSPEDTEMTPNFGARAPAPARKKGWPGS